MTEQWQKSLDVLCPMYLVLSDTGHIVHAGPTAKKLTPNGSLVGTRFLERFLVKRPRNIQSTESLKSHFGTKLHLQLRDYPKTDIKGVIVPSATDTLSIINLSFGISVKNAVRDFSLTSTDFAPTDLTIEMLYLLEAQTAAMKESRKLNKRLQGAKIAAEEQAFTDTLTGLKNRRALDHILGRFRKWNTRFAAMQVDLDFFKTINDSLGHAAGDYVLQKVAQVMVDTTRDSDTVIRVGGDEFVILLPDFSSHESLIQIAERIIDRLAEPVSYGDQNCFISASIGIAVFDPHADQDVDEVLHNADIALYAAKRDGRARVTFYTPDLFEGQSRRGVGL